MVIRDLQYGEATVFVNIQSQNACFVDPIYSHVQYRHNLAVCSETSNMAWK